MRTRLSDILGDLGTTILGLILAAAPLALWIAPTVPAFLAVLVVTISAAAGLCLLDLVRGEGNLIARLRAPPGVHGMSDRFIVGLLKLLPMTHHNRRPGNLEFQRKMDRLKAHMDC